MVVAQCPLKSRLFHGQGFAIAGVKSAERVRFQCGTDCGIAEGFPVAAAREELRLQDFLLTYCAAGSSSGRASMSSNRLSASPNASAGTWKK